MSDRMERETARIAGMLARVLRRVPDQSPATLDGGHESLLAMATAQPANEVHDGMLDSRPLHPLDRLTISYGLSPVELDLLVLTGMPEQHEGYGSVMRSLHPRSESHPTVGLAAQLF